MDSKKRSRNDDYDDEVEESSMDSLEVKRIRADLFEILESEPDRDGSDPDPAVDDLDSVMRSFEEEIATAGPSDPVSIPTPDPYPHQPDLGFLLEASDDELGLPPADNTDCGASAAAAAAAVAAGDAGDAGDALWGLEEFHLGFGSDDSVSGADADDNGVLFDGGLFDFHDSNCGAPEFSDMTWRPDFSV